MQHHVFRYDLNPSSVSSQGEVEQISLMKPKAPTPHDTGMLEYLEDIIGSNRFVDDIEAASVEVDGLNEIRGEKVRLTTLPLSPCP